ncbi:hypothetical protein D3C84_312350 [compost metagenome]
MVVGRTELSIQPGAGNYLYAILEYVVITHAHHAEVEHAVQTRVECRGIGRRVVRRLIDDQVTDGARLRVNHQAAVLRIRSSLLRRIEHRIGQAREEVIGCTKLGVVNAVEVHQIVV